jgi:PPOX class probable F420-dependent enzyme
MTTTLIPEHAHGLLDGPHPCVFTTIRPTGEPLSLVIWCAREGDEVVVNAGERTVWLANIHANPCVSLVVVDPERMYRYLSLSGNVVAVEPDHGFAHINKLYVVYEGREWFWGKAEDGPRYVVRIRPDYVRAYKTKQTG